MNLEDMLVKELQSNEQIVQIIALDDLEKEYLHRKGNVKTGMGFVSPVLDAVKVKTIIKEFGIEANKVLIKQYRQKSYVVFKGYAGQRKILRGTKYLTSNPKVVRMAIGPKGIAKSVKGGFVISVVLSVGIELFDYFVRDTATLSQLLGTVTGDLIKIGLSSLAAAAAGLAVGASVLLGSVAAAPIIVAIGVGVATGFILDAIDKKFGATNALIKGYEQMGVNLKAIKSEFDQGMQQIERNPSLIMCFFGPCGYRY